MELCNRSTSGNRNSPLLLCSLGVWPLQDSGGAKPSVDLGAAHAQKCMVPMERSPSDAQRTLRVGTHRAWPICLEWQTASEMPTGVGINGGDQYKWVKVLDCGGGGQG